MNELYQKRRELLMESKDAPSIAIIYSGQAPMRSVDEEYDFSVDRNFYYLTGIDRENMILLLKKLSDGKVQAQLYIERYDEVRAKWVGARMLPKEATQISGIQSVYYIDEWRDKLNGYMNQCRGLAPVKVYLDLWKYKTEQSHTKAHLCADCLKENYPSVQIFDLWGDMARLRMIKSEEEIELLLKAQECTRRGVEQMMAYVQPGMTECELEGAFDFALKKQGVKEHAFPSIVASGKNATILHYRDNDQIIEDGNLVLVDLGSAYGHYCSDISRTFPANGTFSARQKECYEVVLEAMNLVITSAKPGMPFKELNVIVENLYEKRLKELDLLKDGKTVGDYYYHGVSHHMGLDTHDISTPELDVLQEGMVLTVEPGLYIEAENIGIRIENDILITKDGARDLSEGIIKTVEEIEELMSKK